ncbi:MAG: HEPN domain-containing protein [Spirochaetota bacterium]
MSQQENIAKEYIELAKIDLNASNILYEREIYNISLFELQQAIEKLTKSFCLGIKINNQSIFTLKEMKGKGAHDPLKFLIEIIEKYIALLPEDNVLDKFSIKLKSGVIQQLNLQKTKISQITGKEGVDEINNQINQLNQIKSFNITNIPKEQIKTILSTSYSMNLTEEEFNEKYSELKDNIKNNEFLKILNKIFLPISLLGALTFKHEQSARYPYEFIDGSGKPISHIKPNEYKKGFGVVDSFKNLKELTEFVIKELENEIK